jgi:hypothetical protein
MLISILPDLPSEFLCPFPTWLPGIKVGDGSQRVGVGKQLLQMCP